MTGAKVTDKVGGYKHAFRYTFSQTLIGRTMLDIAGQYGKEQPLAICFMFLIKIIVYFEQAHVQVSRLVFGWFLSQRYEVALAPLFDEGFFLKLVVREDVYHDEGRLGWWIFQTFYSQGVIHIYQARGNLYTMDGSRRDTARAHWDTGRCFALGLLDVLA